MILPPDFPTPHRAGALAQLALVQPDAYALSRNFLQGEVSRLSPYICHGMLTLPEVLEGVLQKPTLSALPIEHKLVYELGWRAYFQHVWGGGRG
jgi:deoxyribodipyrimidine photo-lyase